MSTANRYIYDDGTITINPGKRTLTLRVTPIPGTGPYKWEAISISSKPIANYSSIVIGHGVCTSIFQRD